MKFKPLAVISFCLIALSARADFVFTETFDGFINGGKASENVKDRTKVSVAWTDEAYTKVIRLSDAQKLIGLSELKENKNPKISVVSIPRAGSESSALLFSYRAGKDSWSEQRFALNKEMLGRVGVEEIWIQYDIYIPDNLQLADENKQSGQYFGGNLKMLALYADAYSYPNTTLILAGAFSRKNAAGTTEYDDNVYDLSTFSWYQDGKRIYENFTSESSMRNVIWVDEGDRGSWQRRTIHFKFPTKDMASALPKANGVLRTWVKRADGSVTKTIDLADGVFYGDKNYFNGGYFNGYNNDGFEQETNILIDNVIMAEDADAIDRTAITDVVRPIAPDAKLK